MKPTIFGFRWTRLLAITGAVSVFVAFGLSIHRAPFSFEVTINSSISGKAQVYYDIGQGIREQDSSILSVRQGEGRYRFPLPAGAYRGLRLDPTDQGGNELAVGSLRIVDRSGQSLRTFPNQLAAIQQIDRIQCAPDGCRLKTSRGGDSILSVQLEAPFALVENPTTFWVLCARDFLVCLAGLTASTLLLTVLVRKISPRAVQWSGPALNWATQRPGRAILLVAIGGTLLSCYPIVFFGKSFVSPNIVGSAMLYPRPPFVPGYRGTDLEHSKGVDTGAMLWQNVPYSFIQARTLLRDRELPLWNRYNSGGTPLLAQGLSMFGDPLHTIVILGGGEAWAWDIKFVVAKILFCLALGLLVLRTAKHLPTALLLTTSAAFIGFFSYRFDHPAFFSTCYAPAILLSWVEISRSRTSRAFAAWTLVLLMASGAELNSGGVKEGYMLLFSMHGSGLLFFAMTASAGQRAKKMAFLILSGAAFLLLSAPIWLSFWDTMASSWTAYDNTPSWQIQPGLVLGFFDEIFYRAINREGNVFNPSTNFLVLLGCLWAAADFKKLLRDRIFFALCLASIPTVALVFGVVPPHWISKIPVLGKVGHIDNTFSCALIVQTMVIAGFGLRNLITGIHTGRWRLNYVVSFLGFLILAGLYLGLTHARQRPPNQMEPLGAGISLNWFYYCYVSLIVLSLLALPLLLYLGARRSATRRFMVPLALLCLVALHVRFGTHLRTSVVQIDDSIINPQVRAPLGVRAPVVDWLGSRPSGFRAIGFGDTFFVGYNGIAGVESLSGTDPLQNKYYRELVTSAGVHLVWSWRWVALRESFESMHPLYNLFNVRYFLADPGDVDIDLRGLTPAADLDLKVYENSSAWPRAFYVSAASTYDTIEQFTAMIRDRSNLPFAAIQTSDSVAQLAVLSLAAPPISQVVPAKDYVLTNNHTTFTLEAPGPGIAVLTETYLPGDFVVAINGSTTSYFRVNHAFRGVTIPGAGTYTVTFSYWPRRFTLALWLAAAGALILTLCIVVIFRTKTLEPHPVVPNPRQVC